MWPHSIAKQFSTNCPHQVGNFVSNKSILVLKLFIFRLLGYPCPIFHKNGNVRRNMAPKTGGAWGISILKNFPKTELFWQKCRLPFLYPLAPPEYLKIFRPLGIQVFSLCIHTNSLLSLNEMWPRYILQ